MNGLAPQITGTQSSDLETIDRGRRGRCYVVPRITKRMSPVVVKSLLEQSFSIKGARHFNTLPDEMRAREGLLEAFKRKLDLYPKMIPYSLYVPHYSLSVSSNSLAP